MSNLNLIYGILAYEDAGTATNNNPSQRIPDFTRQYYGISVGNPQGQVFSVPPNSSITLFDGTRAVSLSSSSAFALTNPSGSTYRLTSTAGPNPAFRTPRTLGVDATSTFNVSINNNALVNVTGTSGTLPNFSTVVPGDTLYIDSGSPFSILNKGYFPILAATTTQLSIENNNAIAESNITLSTSFASQFKVFSSDGVQVGDTLVISSGFSTITQGNYEVTAVNTDFIEFTSSRPLPLETATVGVSGLTVYSQAKFFVHIETNQNAVLRLNGDSSDSNKIEPFTADSGGVPGIRGIFSKVGSSYRAVLINKSPTTTASVFLFTAERA